ncbi:MAG TPA: hypothetical protein VHA70_06335 [Bauldia sp.]|nr:hypothetical protein [Bauldia sp.]
MSTYRFVSGGLKVASVVMLLGLAAAPVRAADNPFAAMVGQWNGNGTVTYASGTKERLRCRVRYDQNAQDTILQTLRCASDSYKFQINAFYRNTEGKLNGHWEELTLQVSGSITGDVNPAGKITGNLHGPGFEASVLVDTKGDEQTVSIAAENQDIRSVSVSVKR